MSFRTKKSAASAPAHGLQSAWLPVIESLEGRQFFAVDTVQALPFVLDFAADRGELLDKDNQGTGFTRLQANTAGNQYQKNLIDLDTTAGVLRLTTTGTSVAGGNTNGDNTLVNALETQFNATTSGFKITTRLVGPLSYITKPSQQAGIMFGPDQDNYVKLVAVAQNGSTYIQFMDETKTSTGWAHALGYNTLVARSFTGINTLDLQLVGDASTGKVKAFFAVNGGAFEKFTQEYTVPSAQRAAFFSATGRAGLIALHKNDDAPITATFDSFSIVEGTTVVARPSVTVTRPANGATGVARDGFIAADVSLPTPGAGVDTATLSSNTVKLYRTSDHSPVGAVLNTSGGGDAIVLTPTTALEPGVSYTFEVTDGLTDTSGAAFVPYTATFTTTTAEIETDPNLAFEKVNLSKAQGHTYTGVTIGPDRKLYASTIEGLVQRFTINADGTLGDPQNITSLQTKEGGQTMLIGMAFDPASTASNLILWVTHNQYTDINAPVADDFTGKISKLSGANLQNVTTAVVNLPRSVRDHLTNQLAFGPDGAIYFNQGANTAMGAPDNAWGLREEHLLNAAILRLDTSLLPTNGAALDVKTPDVGGTYNPFNASNALTIYATGVRNSYDLVWTSTGRLFAPSNGSAAGGSTPGTPAGSYSFGQNERIDFSTNGAYTGPNVAGISPLQQTQNDYLFNVVQGGYYGNPNRVRGEFVLNGGNPTSGADGVTEVSAYPVGTLPDRNYRGRNSGLASKTQGSAYSFGKNYSPNGIIEYRGDAFGGALKGKLLVAEYSGGDDIVVLSVDANGNVMSAKRGIAGLTHFTDPLDLIEDPQTGFLYVAEFGGQKLTLVRPIAPGANATPDKTQMVFNDGTNNAGPSPVQTIKITNTGTTTLAIGPGAIELLGVDKARFALVNPPAGSVNVAPGDSFTLQVTYNAAAGATPFAINAATLSIQSNSNGGTLSIPLRGIVMANMTGGANEPSLQKVLDLYRIGVNVGDSDKNTTDLNGPVNPNDELPMQTLVKAGAGPVTIEPLAVFGVGNATIPTFRFGHYTPGNHTDKTELLKVVGNGANQNNSQSVNPVYTGTTTFDPGGDAFGLYTWWQSFTATNSPTLFSEDQLNKLAGFAYDDQPHKVRFYPLKDANGVVVPDAYIFAFEEYDKATDQQDFVGIIRNVKPAPTGSGAEIGFENLDGPVFNNHLAFNKIQDFTNDAVADNIFHQSAKLRIRNTGTAALVLGNVTASAGWTVSDVPAAPIPVGGFADITVTFTANPGVNVGQLLNGTLTIASNDADEPTSTITLAGWWQPRNEDNKEPSLQNMFDILGFKTAVVKPGQSLGTGNGARVGDEVRSAYWNRADATLPVSVRQLSAWHGQGNTEQFRWHLKTSGTATTLFTHDGDEGQSFLPHLNNATVGVVGAAYAAGTFSPSSTFGFKVQGAGDRAWSDPLKNANDQWEVRLWVARDRDGKIIPNAYLLTMDYFGTAGTNYDFNDNVYLITNVQPESGPSAPANAGASASGGGIALTWDDNAEPNLAGYNVYRSSSAAGTFTKVNAELLHGSGYIDTAAPVGQASYYIIKAVDSTGTESAASTVVNATRANDTQAPGTPKSFSATGAVNGISLDWADNTEGDFAGYHIYRSNAAGGPWTKIANLHGSSSYFDSAVSVGVTMFYQVSAVDLSGNESGVASASAARQSNDTTAPAKPTNFNGTGSNAGIALDWSDNTEGDLAGYNVYRIANGQRVKLNFTLLTASQFNDTNAPAGATSTYEVEAVDVNNNISAAATTSALRPADTTKPANPSGLAVTAATTSGVALNWNDNTDADLAGYNVYRSTSPDGGFTKVNASGLIAASQFTDTGAPDDVVVYYRVTAVDASGNESDPSNTVSATRPAPDTLKPAAPAGVNAVANQSSITVSWVANIESDLAGYNVYRSSAANGTYSKVNVNGLLTGTTLVDTTAPTGTSFYVVRAVDTTGNESDPSAPPASATRVAAYTQVDIGNPTPAGSINTVVEGSDYNLIGGGTDVYGTADSFSFGYQQITGDFDIKVRLAGLTNTNGLAKAGLMARESLAANSRNAFVLATPGSSGHRFTYRAATGGATTAGGSGAVSYPNNWLRLVRVGNTFTGYRSTDGTNWVQIGTAGITMPQTLFFGMAAVSKNATTATTAQFRNLSGTSVGPVDPAPAAPANASAVGSQSGITLDWNDNTEADLAGYNVYRSSAANGTFTKINLAGLLTSSTFVDTNAPAGQTSYYRIVAVDNANQESTPATASAPRPTGPDTQAPAAPAGVGATPSQSGIVVNWSANTESDLAGYNIFRSTSPSSGFTQINTGGLLTGTSFNDTNAPAGVVSYYRVAAVDTSGNVSGFGTTSATRPTQSVGPIKINFQLAGSPAVAGYEQDNGAVVGVRTNGMTYGWSVNHADVARDRNKNANQLVDTLVHMRAGSNWSINLPNGTYDVKIGVGDSQYTTTNTINANGVNFWTNQALAVNTFASKTLKVTVTNGKLTIDNGGSADQTTRINYVEISPAAVVTPPTKINFQLAGTPAVAGYVQDNGFVYGDRNGLTYGWNADYSSNARDRNKNSNQLLDTLMHFSAGSNWSIAMANGTYNVTLSVGDSGYATTQTLSANGVSFFNGTTLAVNQFAQKTLQVTVSNGKLTLTSSGADRDTRINYIEVAKA